MRFTTTLIIALLTFLSQTLYAQKIKDIDYKVRPIALEDRTNLEVTITTTSKTPLKIQKLKDRYGTPNIHKYVTSIEALNGSLVTGDTIISPNTKGKIALKYTLSFQPNSSNTFGPYVSPNNFHVFNCQWMLCLGDKKEKRNYTIQLTDLPKNWDGYNSFNQERLKAKITSDYDAIFGRVLGAAKQSHNSIKIRKSPLDIYIHGEFELDKSVLIASVEKIIEKQRSLFDDFDFPFFNIIILAKEGNIAGINTSENTFVCYLKEDATLEQLTYLIAHEVLHTWIGKKIDIVLEKGAIIYRDHWFTEGFTDYLANVIRLESGIINKNEFVDIINQYFININDNNYAHYSLDELETAAKVGLYGIEPIKLQYYKGALIALNVETQLKEINSPYQLKDLIKKLFALAKKKGEKLTRAELFSFFKTFNIDIDTMFKNHVKGNLPIVPYKNALGNAYKLELQKLPKFDLGFNLYASSKTKTIRGVNKNSEAYKAGLRNGIKYISISNSNRFSNAWEQDKPIIVTVSVNDIEREISYLPKGEKTNVWQFVKR